MRTRREKKSKLKVTMLSLRQIGLTAARVAVNDDPTRLAQRCLWTTAWLGARWEKKNLQVYPPQGPEEPRRPAEVYHCRRQIKYSKDKMWYIAKLIRGMSIDQAIAQLGFLDKKGAKIAQEVLKEAQEMAVKDHNVEYRSNLYVAQTFSGKGSCLKRIRYHGRGRFGIMEKVYSHYFVKLVEGQPPPVQPSPTNLQRAQSYLKSLRSRTIVHSL